MGTEPDISTQPIQLDDTATSVYLRILQNDGADSARLATELEIPDEQVTEAVDVLLRMRLIRRGGERGFTPVRPDLAVAELTAPLEAAIEQHSRQLRTLRETMLALLPHYLEHDAARGGLPGEPVKPQIDLLDDPRDVRMALIRAAQACRTSVLTVQPGGRRSPDVLADALPRDLAMLERGVRMRVVYQHTVRADLTTKAYVSAITAAGAEVRTTDQIPERLMIFDGSTAFLPDRSRSGPPGATVVRAPTVIAYLERLGEHLWQTALPLEPGEIGYRRTGNDLRQSIVRLLAHGLSDKAVARRLGMSLRTCQRHIAVFMAELGSENRFQAGAAAQAAGLLEERGLPADPEAEAEAEGAGAGAGEAEGAAEAGSARAPGEAQPEPAEDGPGPAGGSAEQQQPGARGLPAR